jgi:hypothetical protein
LSKLNQKLKKTSVNNSVKSKIETVENEFHQWADEFIKNKESKKLLIKKQKISLTESRIKKSNTWLPGFQAFIDFTKNSIIAYNAKSKSNIQYDLPTIPNDIFIKSGNSYFGSVIFKNDVIWEIAFYPPNELDQDYSPTLHLNIYNSNVLDKEYGDRFSATTDQLLIFTHGNSPLTLHRGMINDRFDLSYIKKEYKLTTAIETLSELAIDIFEAQLLQL